MNVTVEVVGEGSHDFEVEDATYADLLAEVDLSPHEVSVMVDGRPVPEDQPVETDHVKVLRLIKGGSGPGDESGNRTETEIGSVADEAEAGPVSELDRERDDLGVSDLDFELPNAGAGPDPLVLSDLAESGGDRTVARSPRSPATGSNDAVVLYFQRDYHCRKCREQVQDVADRYDEFRDRRAVVVSVLPESKAKAEKWQQKFHLPFPLVADEEKTAGEQYGQPTRFGKLGELSDLVGRMPEVAILDARGGELRLHAVHRGDNPADRPSVDDVLAMVDRMLADERE
jgi:peroxiredoxin Q/BCP